MANRIPYYIAFGCFIVSFICCATAFGTGYWFVSKGDHRLFQRLGLWEACFNGYEHTSDYIGKAYYGCWWIFHKEYSYIREWILPPWFIAVQTLMTFAVVLHIIGLAIFPSASKERENVKRQTILTIIALFTFLSVAISVVTFGAMIGEDRTWMPRPDNDDPSWSFGLAVVSGFFSAFTFIGMMVYTLTRKYELLPTDETDYKMQSIAMKPKV